MEEDTYRGMIPPVTLPYTAKSFNEQDVAPPRLTEDIIIDAEETANEDDGKPLFHIPDTPRLPHRSRQTSMCKIGVDTLDLLNGPGITLQDIINAAMDEEENKSEIDIKGDRSFHI